MANKGKTKGNAGELKIAKFLSELYGAKFIRSESNSLIIPPFNMQRLSITCQVDKSFPFENLLKNKAIPILDNWISQTVNNINKDDFWILIFRINHKGSFVVFNRNEFYKFKAVNYCHYYSYIITEFEQFFVDNKDSIFYSINE